MTERAITSNRSQLGGAMKWRALTSWREGRHYYGCRAVRRRCRFLSKVSPDAACQSGCALQNSMFYHEAKFKYLVDAPRDLRQ